MTCKIQLLATGEEAVVLRVSGRMREEHVSVVKDLIERQSGAVALDLTEVTLVAREAVTFLATCELKGVEFLNCPPFLREWINRQQLGIAAETLNAESEASNEPEDGKDP